MTPNDSQKATIARQAKLAYTAYGDSVGWVNHQGQPMPQFSDLGPAIQAAWRAAAWECFAAGYRLGVAHERAEAALWTF